MKKILLITAMIGFTLFAAGQGKSQKKEQVKTTRVKKNTNANSSNSNNRDGASQANTNTSVKYSKNLPTNVSKSFTRDYPNAANVTWTKSQGNWIATFADGYYRNSVIYSANGDRTSTTRRRLRL